MSALPPKEIHICFSPTHVRRNLEDHKANSRRTIDLNREEVVEEDGFSSPIPKEISIPAESNLSPPPPPMDSTPPQQVAYRKVTNRLTSPRRKSWKLEVAVEGPPRTPSLKRGSLTFAESIKEFKRAGSSRRLHLNGDS